MRQFNEFLFDVEIQGLKLFENRFGECLSISEATLDILELLPYRKDKPDGLLCLLIQLFDLEQILVLKLSEVVDRKKAVELSSLFPAGADVLSTFLVVED